MRIKEMMISEAARFGNKEKSILAPYLRRFKIGCEYEFNVYEGVPYLDKFIKHDDPYDVPAVKNNRRNIDKIGKGISKIFEFGGTRTLKEYKTDIQNAVFGEDDEDFIAILIESTLPEVAELSTWFIANIYKPSSEIRRNYRGDMFESYGLLSSNFPDKEIVAISKASQYSYGIQEELSTPLLMMFGQAVDGLIRYTNENLKGFKSQTVEYYDIVDTIEDQLLKEAVENTKKPSKVEVVDRDIPIDRKYISGVVFDVSVPDGAEVITKPLSVMETFDVMDEIFEYIKDVGYTDMKTGLHVNISIDGVDLKKVNAVKMMTLLDVEFMQGLTKTAKEFIKYPVRSEFVKPNTSIFREPDTSGVLGVEKLAMAYLRGGTDALVSAYEQMILADNKKERAINLVNVFNADVSQRRIEFRLFGPSESKGYEYRPDEIQNDILQICYVILASTDESFLRTEYLRGIIRILDRSVQAVQINGMRFASFSSLTNFMKNS